MKSVCIVGAGPAGLAAAKVLLHTDKFDVTVFEKAPRVGGIWALDEDSNRGFLHPHTPTNLSRFTVSFSDLDWHSVTLNSASRNRGAHATKTNSKTPMFPKAWQVNRYLETYRAKYIPDRAIKLEHEIVKTVRSHSAGGRGWIVTIRNRQTQPYEQHFDFLLLASGFFSTPRPISFNIAGASSGGEVAMIHSSKFRKLADLFARPEDATGKKILLIGGGNSAGEAAAAVAQQLSDMWFSPVTGRQQLYENCKIVHVAPRPNYALAPYSPVDEGYNSFVPVDLKLYDLARRPAGTIVGNAGRLPATVKDMIHEALQTQIGGNQSDLGSAGLTIPTEEPRSAVQVALAESLSEHVRSGLIEVISGRVTELGQGNTSAQIQTVTGVVRVENIGAIIYATGYSPASAVDFLPEEVKQELHYDPVSLRLPLILQGWQTMTPAVPELAFLGFYEGPYWPMIEMQARLTAHRWLSSDKLELRQPYEATEKLLDLRKAMQDRELNVPQYWFNDYLGYLEEMSAYLKLERNDGLFAEREGCTSPARYLSVDSDKSQADAIMKDLYEVWNACRDEGRYIARATFRALQGNWNIRRTIASALSSFPSGTLEGTASFHPRLPSPDNSGKHFDFEYLYIESGTLFLTNGASLPARRRYVYRYSEERDELSVWFVKPDDDLEVDYLFHNLDFASPAEAKKEGACIAKADHLCVEDMYWTEYRLPIKGIALHNFQTNHTVKGPSKDYVMSTKYTRPALK